MAKELLNLGQGALVVSEEAGDVTLTVSEKAALGGGQAAGVLTVEGEGKIVLHGKQAFDLAMEILKANAPAPLAVVVEAAKDLADEAIAKA